MSNGTLSDGARDLWISEGGELIAALSGDCDKRGGLRRDCPYCAAEALLELLPAVTPKRWVEPEREVRLVDGAPTCVTIFPGESAAPQARVNAFDRARVERGRAHAKHGERSMESAPWHDPTGRRMRVLVEEVGEVAQELNDAEVEGRPVDADKLAAELIQVTAMAGAWADAALRADLR